MATVNTKEEIARSRAEMIQNGWVYAVDERPGAYVPGPSLRKAQSVRRWAVSLKTLHELVKERTSDPEILKQFSQE